MPTGGLTHQPWRRGLLELLLLLGAAIATLLLSAATAHASDDPVNPPVAPKAASVQTPNAPNAPTQPTRPTAPNAPTQPTRPTAPTAPTAPVVRTPTAPTAPTAPTEPTAPTAPTAPSGPGSSGSSGGTDAGQPADPAQPAPPGQSGAAAPTTPASAATPTQSETDGVVATSEPSAAVGDDTRPGREPALGHAAVLDPDLVRGATADSVTSGSTDRPGVSAKATDAPATQPAPSAPTDDQGPLAPAQAPSAPVSVGQGTAGAVPETWTPDAEHGVDRFPHDDAKVPPSRAGHVDIWPG